MGGSANKAHRSSPDIVKQIKVVCELRQTTSSESPNQSSSDCSGTLVVSRVVLAWHCWAGQEAKRLQLPSYITACSLFWLIRLGSDESRQPLFSSAWRPHRRQWTIILV